MYLSCQSKVSWFEVKTILIRVYAWNQFRSFLGHFKDSISNTIYLDHQVLAICIIFVKVIVISRIFIQIISLCIQIIFLWILHVIASEIWFYVAFEDMTFCNLWRQLYQIRPYSLDKRISFRNYNFISTYCAHMKGFVDNVTDAAL